MGAPPRRRVRSFRRDGVRTPAFPRVTAPSSARRRRRRRVATMRGRRSSGPLC